MTSHDLVKRAPRRLYRKRDGIGQTPCSYERYLVCSALAVSLASADYRQSGYATEQSCTSDEAQTVVKKKSKIQCAAACSEQRGCREYNFIETTKDCYLYRHKALFFSAQPGCSRYKARISRVLSSLNI